MTEKNSIFETLNSINVNDKTEKKNDLTYLSWAWAWGELKKRYPNAIYTIERFGEEKKPYLYDEELGYMVFTSMTIDGLTHEMWLPVMDSANKSMKNKPYSYKVKKWNKATKTFDIEERTCGSATMFDINKTIMRCLVKNIGMFGLGLYIYAGEDLPNEIETEPKQETRTQEIEFKKMDLGKEIQEYTKANAEYKKFVNGYLKKVNKSRLGDLELNELEDVVETGRAMNGKA